MRSEIEIIESCLRGLTSAEPGQAVLAPDVSWEGPPAPGRLTGAEVSKLLSRFAPLVGEISVDRHIVEGPHVASLLEIRTVAGSVPAFVFFRLSNGLIKEIRTFYDPRGVQLGASGVAATWE